MAEENEEREDNLEPEGEEVREREDEAAGEGGEEEEIADDAAHRADEFAGLAAKLDAMSARLDTVYDAITSLTLDSGAVVTEPEPAPPAPDPADDWGDYDPKDIIGKLDLSM